MNITFPHSKITIASRPCDKAKALPPRVPFDTPFHDSWYLLLRLVRCRQMAFCFRRRGKSTFIYGNGRHARCSHVPTALIVLFSYAHRVARIGLLSNFPHLTESACLEPCDLFANLFAAALARALGIKATHVAAQFGLATHFGESNAQRISG